MPGSRDSSHSLKFSPCAVLMLQLSLMMIFLLLVLVLMLLLLFFFFQRITGLSSL